MTMAMSDKERILICLVNRIYCKALHGSPVERREWLDMQPGLLSGKNPLQPGDLVTAFTSIVPNEWMVGFVHEVKEDYVVIREIGSDRLCNYGNETFLRIDKNILGYEILEGVQYQIYNKVKKAFTEASFSYTFRFKDLSFQGDTCRVEGRRAFQNETAFQIEFCYDSETTIESIVELLNKAENSAIDSPSEKP